MAKHARLSPSKADLWMVCPGGIPFAESLADQLGSRSEDVSSPAAAAGTMAHEYSEETILSHLHPEESVRDLHRENANVIRPKMEGALLKNAEMYASWAVGFVSTHPNIPWGVELSAPLWYEPKSKGTADFWAVDGDTLIVVDYKSGRIKVEVENNLQIAIYLIAIYDEIKAFNPQINKFRAGVHQPFSMREGKRDPSFWDFDMEELTHLRRTLSAGAKEVWEPIAGNHRLIASTKGCRFCPAKPLCPAQAAPVLEFAGLVDEDPKGLDNDVVFDLYRQLPALRAFMKSLEEHVEEESDE